MNYISSLVEYILDTFILTYIDSFNLEAAEITLFFWLVLFMRGLWNYQNIIISKSNLSWLSVLCWWKPKFWQYCCWTMCGWLFPSLWEMGATSCSAVHVHSVVYPLELQWHLLLSVTSPQRSHCFSGFGSSKAALRLTEEGWSMEWNKFIVRNCTLDQDYFLQRACGF